MTSSESIFMDDPFFANSFFLWPRRSLALSSIGEDFLHRRAQIMQNLRNEIRDSLWDELTEGLCGELFQSLDGSSAFSRLFSTNTEQNKRRDVSLTLDTQGFSPEDVTVTVSGRRLEVMAGKRAKTDTSSSSTVTESQPQGFVQAMQLPDHLDPTSLTCSLGEDGLLHIELPESKGESSDEQVIPIRFRTSLNFPINKDSTNKMEDGAEKSN